MAEKKCNNCETSGVEHSLEWEMMKELTKAVKRSYVIIITVLALWFATIGIFIWYINQYDFTSYEVQQDGEWGNTFIDGGNEGDITYGAEDSGSQKNAEESQQS